MARKTGERDSWVLKMRGLKARWEGIPWRPIREQVGQSRGGNEQLCEQTWEDGGRPGPSCMDRVRPVAIV